MRLSQSKAAAGVLPDHAGVFTRCACPVIVTSDPVTWVQDCSGESGPCPGLVRCATVPYRNVKVNVPSPDLYVKEKRKNYAINCSIGQKEHCTFA